MIFGRDRELCEWASNNIFGRPDVFDGVAIGEEIDGKIICAVIYNNYIKYADGTPQQIEMSISSTNPKWASRRSLRTYFGYPFNQLGVPRVQSTTSVKNKAANDMLSRLGFTLEGLHRKAYPNGDDAYSWSLLREECHWLKGVK